MMTVNILRSLSLEYRSKTHLMSNVGTQDVKSQSSLYGTSIDAERNSHYRF